MPKTGKNDHARKDELPSTLQRSGRKAQDTFAKTYDSALETYDNDEGRAGWTPTPPKSTCISVPRNWTSRAARKWARQN